MCRIQVSRPQSRVAARDLVTLPALLACAFVAGVALAGAAVGPAAVVLGIPAGLLIGLSQRRTEEREAALRLLSQQDALTGLGNRRLLQHRLGYEIARHRRHQRRFAVLALDLDGFKAVNDRFGHQAGDEVLREIAWALQRAVRDQDTLVRLGGDEFCVLAPESAYADAERLSDRLRNAVRGAVEGVDRLDVSVGYAVFPDEGTTPEALMAHADAAAIDAKRLARARRGRPQSRAA
jgi:diguanylate cyclase (GGDEF)-like protein